MRWGLVVQRAPTAHVPDALRVFTRADDTDIDRFQESALFPGTPVAIVHESRDGAVVVRRAARAMRAWIEKRHVARRRRATSCSATPQRTPYRVVTGATVRTVLHPRGAAAVANCSSTWACACRCSRTWPADQTVNGQHPYAAHVIELPVRERRRRARVRAGAAAARAPTSQRDYLPLTRANVLRQGFKFLGERYGWGHDYNARDCSGFVSEVYRSFGVLLPRNTRDQAVSPTLRPHRVRRRARTREQRLATRRARCRSATSSTSPAT